jgi:hypothetical protein
MKDRLSSSCYFGIRRAYLSEASLWCTPEVPRMPYQRLLSGLCHAEREETR